MHLQLLGSGVCHAATEPPPGVRASDQGFRAREGADARWPQPNVSSGVRKPRESAGQRPTVRATGENEVPQ